MCGVNMENHEEAHISYAVRLGKVFGLRPNTFIILWEVYDMEQVRQLRNVAIVIYEQVEPLDFVGPFEVFIAGSNRGQDFREAFFSRRAPS